MKPRLRPVLPTLKPGVVGRAKPASSLPFPLASPRSQLWYLGRNAIYAALGELDLRAGDAVLVPSYTNGVEVAALAARGLAVHQVQITPDFQLDLDDLERQLVRTRARLVLAIQYLGFPKPLKEVVRLCRVFDAKVLEDCALSFLSAHPDGTPAGLEGDFAIFSVYKTLPVPDGAALVVNDHGLRLPPEPKEPASSSSVSGIGRLLLSGARSGGIAGQVAAAGLDAARRLASLAFSRAGVERTAAGSMRFETKRLAWGASRFTRRILPRLDYEQIVAQRRANFLRLRERLSDVPTFFETLPAGACPLFYPVIVSDKQRVMARLAGKGIETVDFWSTWHAAAPPDAFPNVARLRTSVVELPCLQDLGEPDMDFIAASLREALAPSRNKAFVPEAAPATA